jgi:hypothetical protein
MARTIAWGSSGTGSSITPEDFPGLLNFKFDSFEVTTKTIDGPTEIKYYTGGIGGTLVATITIVYDLEGDIESVERS